MNCCLDSQDLTPKVFELKNTDEYHTKTKFQLDAGSPAQYHPAVHHSDEIQYR
jgi:hypothetical protein